MTYNEIFKEFNDSFKKMNESLELMLALRPKTQFMDWENDWKKLCEAYIRFRRMFAELKDPE